MYCNIVFSLVFGMLLITSCISIQHLLLYTFCMLIVHNFLHFHSTFIVQDSNLAGTRWPPHLLTGPQMSNSVGSPGPQIKLINNGLTTLYPRVQGTEHVIIHFISKWCWLLPGIGVGAGRRLLSLGRVKLIDKGLPR